MPNQHMFTMEEAALAYALTAEKLFGNDAAFLNHNPAVVPVFVTHLFQSLEISLKAVGIDSGIITISEARERRNRSGHGIRELANLVSERLGADSCQQLVLALTFANTSQHTDTFIEQMIEGEQLENTRLSYAQRKLGYGEVSEGDFALIEPILEWIEAVKQTASNLNKAKAVIRGWNTCST